ncbi:DUF4430 domain-containing protein [Dyella acidisoli]|uniref:Transcobalamin-like C-terminal domain-containing protein n=1 Tax=Dyella acidisoli TaxID=1867834 RepID=A0ABQ5XJU9_9GAMM|nr:DUF4430 domain-containing protein [Dyella acidisoli]GLQ91970.1 hypothetical protein GCM10007901_09210 [Dyella acidisoli]
MGYTVEINIYADQTQPPSLILSGIPWYAGMTALQAMIIGEALNTKNFAFRVEYRSIYGAQIDSIDGLSDGDQPNHYWLLFVDGKESLVGASEAIIKEDPSKRSSLVEWKYTDMSAQAAVSLPLKTRPL